MEMSVAEEEIPQQSESTNVATKSSVSIINIGSMVVDISIPVKKNDNVNCRHFSIRGYVAEMREKNRKICEPFSSGTGHDNLEQLPPLIVPKNRYWRCESEDGSKCWESELVSDGPCVSMSSCGEAAIKLPEMLQNAAIEVTNDASPPGINAKIHASTSSDGQEISADKGEVVLKCFEKGESSSGHGKEVSADTEMDLPGDENGSGNIQKQKDGDELLNKSSSSQAESTDCTVSLQLNCNELVSPTDQNISGPDVPVISPPIELNKYLDGVSSEIFVSKEKNIAADERGISQPSNMLINTNEPVGVCAVLSTRTPSTQEEECNNASSDSEETLDGCSDHRQNNDDSNSLPRRKPRKVRLIADLLSRKDIPEGECTRNNDTSYNSVATKPTGLVTVVAREALAPHEDLGKGKQNPSRKRKISNLDDSRSIEIRGLSNVTKKARSSRIGCEKPHKTSDFPKESEESHRSKHKNDRPLLLFKNKSLIQASLDQVASERPDAVMDTLNVASSACRREETEKCIKLNKGKSPEVQNDYMSLSPANLSNIMEIPSQSNQAETLWSVSDRIQSSENDASTKVCLDLSLGRPLSSEVVAKDTICKTSPTYLQQSDRPGGYPIVKNVNVEQLRPFNNPSPSRPMEKDLTWDLGGRIAHRTGITPEKQIYSAVSEKRGYMLQEKVDANGKDKEVQGLGERAAKALDNPYSDDIPMEIVELMAKNQYERQMAGGEGRSLSKRTDFSTGGSVSINQRHPIKWLHKTPGTMKNPFARSENAINFSSSADQGHLNLSYLEENQLNFFGASSENRQKLSNVLRYPVSGSGSQPSEGGTPTPPPTWLSKNKNLPFGLGIPQQFTTLADNARSAESQHKGRTISDFKSAEMKMQSEMQPNLLKPGEAEVYPIRRGSLDPYANETIPAMHLLSLMNKGMPPNAAFDADAHRFLSSSRGDYHQGFSFDPRHNVVDRSFSLHQHHGPGVYFAGEGSSRHSSSFSSQMSFRSQHMDETTKWAPPVILGAGSSQKNLPRSDAILMSLSQPSFSRKEKQNQDKQRGGMFGTSNSRQVLGQCERYYPRFIDLQADNVTESALPSMETLKMEECKFNQNPADFSIPEPGNEFTISGRDLKLPRKEFYRERSYSAANVDGRKRQRPMKESSTGKKHAHAHAHARPRAS